MKIPFDGHRVIVNHQIKAVDHQVAFVKTQPAVELLQAGHDRLAVDVLALHHAFGAKAVLAHLEVLYRPGQIGSPLGAQLGCGLGDLALFDEFPDTLQQVDESLSAGVDDAGLARLRSPIGLDIGARTPEETAISIAAEIVQQRWGGSGSTSTVLPATARAATETARFT